MASTAVSIADICRSAQAASRALAMLGSSAKDDPAAVARDGFEALMADKGQVVAGSLKNKIQTAGARLMPDQLRAAVHARMTRPKEH